MTIIYVPRQESHTQEVSSIKEIIAITDTFNPYEQKQYKRFIFCNMTKEEEEMVRHYLKTQLSEQSGVPTKDVLKGQPEMNYIYLAEIGLIKLR